jgi:hypothetical protein
MEEIYKKLISITNLIVSIKADHMNLYSQIETINKQINYRDRNMVDLEEMYQFIDNLQMEDESTEDSGYDPQ